MAASSHPALRHLPSAGPPPVRIEVRHGNSRPIIFDVSGEEFLIGSVPGCDLRLPGTNLPPVVCLIARQTDGVRLRKLAPSLPVLVNGQPIGQASATTLTHGDCISVGAVDIIVSIDFAVGSVPVPSSKPAPEEVGDPFAKRDRELTDRERQLEEATRELEADRVLWYRRRDEIEQEIANARATGNSNEKRLAAREQDLERRQAELRQQQDELLRLREETLAAQRNQSESLDSEHEKSLRDALERIRQREEGLEAELAARRQAFEDELRSRREALPAPRDDSDAAERLRRRSEELDRFQISLREAAVQLREQKRKLDDEVRAFEARQDQLAEREVGVRTRAEDVDARLAELGNTSGARLRELVDKEADLARREADLTVQLEAINKEKLQYQEDLVRLDRAQAALAERERQLQTRAEQIDRRFEQCERDTRDLEDQVLQIDAREEQFRAEEERQARQRRDIEERDARLHERLAQIESQQVMLATLRTRLEHLRAEQQAEAGRIAEERARLDEHIAESKQRLQDAERIREQLSTDQVGYTEAEKVFRERSELLQQAVARIRDLQAQMNAEDVRLRQAADELAAKTAELTEREGMLQARTDQLMEAQRRLEADRDALKQREESFFLTEGTRETLQDQLRRRAEELMTRHRELEARAAEIEAQRAAIEQLHGASDEVRQQIEAKTAELAARDEELRAQAARYQEAEQRIAEQRTQFDEAHARWELERQQAEAKATQARDEIAALKQALSKQAADLMGQVPDMESRAQAVLDRTTQARESLRAQLNELHTYARQSQEDLDKVRAQVQAEVERLSQQETSLNRSRAEHRLATASFRQQLVEWQGRFSSMKQMLSQGESRIERREKDVAATTQQLARQAEELEAKEREVGERRDEMHRHLNDMREWYRRKLRELVHRRGHEGEVPLAEAVDADIIPMPPPNAAHANQPQPTDHGRDVILSIRDELDPADRKLGELLQTLELVETETLDALWSEARRQHRPLRQVLLAGGYLTLYQLALIESGNLSGLVLGRFRVIDRLQSTPREAIYRVFDPMLGANTAQPGVAERGGICVLRHLGEIEMHDAVRPDEYRQRFGAARDLAHPNVAATLELLDINGRPAVVQEWLHGLSGSDFPAAAGAPGVWFRLLSQAAIGLHTAHQAGLIHGRLTPDTLVLTPAGVLKIAGFGEPPWLHPGNAIHEAVVEDDLRALGQIVSGWIQLAPKRKGKKAATDLLPGLLRGLGLETSEGAPAVYPSVALLLEEIDRVAAEVPDDSAAWEKLLAHAGENATDGPLLRQSA